MVSAPSAGDVWIHTTGQRVVLWGPIGTWQYGEWWVAEKLDPFITARPGLALWSPMPERGLHWRRWGQWVSPSDIEGGKTYHDASDSDAG